MNTNILKMNAYFSFHRIKLLAIRFFSEHWRRDLITLAVYFIAFAFVPRITDYNNSAPFILFSLILIVGGVRFAARIFHEIHHPSGGMHFLHIPASRLEKFLFNGVTTLLLYPAVCLLLSFGGTLFGNLLAPIMPSFFNYPTIDLSVLIPKHNIWEIATQFLLLHAIFFLGSLIFKKHPTTKTFLSIIVFGFAVMVVELILIKIFLGGVSTSSEIALNLKMENLFGIMTSSALLTFVNILVTAFVLFYLYIVSYFKFKEKQV